MRGSAKRASEQKRIDRRRSPGAHPERLRSRDIGNDNQRARKSELKAAKCAASAAPKLRSSVSPDRRTLTVHMPLKLHKRGGRKLVVSPDGVISHPGRAQIDNTLVKALARAHRWQNLIENGTHASIAEIARAEGINDSYVSRLMRLTLLAPDLVEAILNGRQVQGVQIEMLPRRVPTEWQKQQEIVKLSI
jgi:hypothetical protein